MTNTILEQMEHFAVKRAEKMETVPLHDFPPISDYASLTWIGTFSYSNMAMKQRVIDADNLITRIPGILQTPPEVTRDYLRAKYTEPRRHTIEQYGAINQHRSAPLYAKRGYFHDMAYVDLRAAYWSILQICGWDVDYHPSRWLGKRSDNDDFPLPEHKIARSALVSTGLLTPTHVWTGKALQVIKAHSPYVNYDLWAVVNDVLHSIASIALRAGACHIHTDGYIVPMKNANLLIDEINHWGLHAEIRDEGDAAIKGVGAYRIGQRKTKKAYHFAPDNINKVYETDISFLRSRFHKLALTSVDWSIHDC